MKMVETFVTRCKACGAEIEFRQIWTPDGYKWHPFNIGTNTSHFETCPFRQQFMKPKPTKKVIRVRESLDDYIGE
jgi:hypothetical protein